MVIRGPQSILKTNINDILEFAPTTTYYLILQEPWYYCQFAATTIIVRRWNCQREKRDNDTNIQIETSNDIKSSGNVIIQICVALLDPDPYYHSRTDAKRQTKIIYAQTSTQLQRRIYHASKFPNEDDSFGAFFALSAGCPARSPPEA